MWGSYDNFPRRVHRKACFVISISNKRLQKILLQLFQEINREKFRLEDVAHPSIPHCTVIFEFGIAKAKTFHYLSKEKINKVLKATCEKKLQVMDFFCAVRYYRKRKEERRPLNFDYYILRFRFDKGSREIQLFHEEGPRHISPQEIIKFLADQINKTLTGKTLTISFTS